MADKKVEAKKADAKKADAKKPAKKNKQNVFQKLFKYLSACKGELKKITWPSPKQTTKNFGIVIGVIVVVGLFIFGLDRGLFRSAWLSYEHFSLISVITNLRKEESKWQIKKQNGM